MEKTDGCDTTKFGRKKQVVTRQSHTGGIDGCKMPSRKGTVEIKRDTWNMDDATTEKHVQDPTVGRLYLKVETSRTTCLVKERLKRPFCKQQQMSAPSPPFPNNYARLCIANPPTPASVTAVVSKIGLLRSPSNMPI